MFAPLTAAEWSAISLSLQVAIAATLVAFPFALAVSWWLARTKSPLKTFVEGLVSLPLVLPPVVVGFGLLLLFGRSGPIGGWLYSIGISLPFSWAGAVLAAALMGFPLMVRAMRLSLEAVTPELEEAAASLGASPLRRVRTIVLPLAAPGLIAGSVLCFARALGEFGATITFAGNIPGVTRTVPVAVYTLLQQPGGENAVLRLALISVVLAFAALIIGEWLTRRHRHMQRGASS